MHAARRNRVGAASEERVDTTGIRGSGAECRNIGAQPIGQLESRRDLPAIARIGRGLRATHSDVGAAEILRYPIALRLPLSERVERGECPHAERATEIEPSNAEELRARTERQCMRAARQSE